MTQIYFRNPHSKIQFFTMVFFTITQIGLKYTRTQLNGGCQCSGLLKQLRCSALLKGTGPRRLSCTPPTTSPHYSLVQPGLEPATNRFAGRVATDKATILTSDLYSWLLHVPFQNLMCAERKPVVPAPLCELLLTM